MVLSRKVSGKYKSVFTTVENSRVCQVRIYRGKDLRILVSMSYT